MVKKKLVAYAVNIRVPEERLEFYLNRMDELGLSEGGCLIDRGKHPADPDKIFSYLLFRDRKELVLNFCVREGFGSWCKPI
ncbi:MAG: hypothetical protein AABX11_03600 [Nanoarchaeota archaeon]